LPLHPRPEGRGFSAGHDKNSNKFKNSLIERNLKYALLKQYGIPTRKNIKGFIHINNNVNEFHSSKEDFAKLFNIGVTTVTQCLEGENNRFNLRFLNERELIIHNNLRNLIMTGKITEFNPTLLIY